MNAGQCEGCKHNALLLDGVLCSDCMKEEEGNEGTTNR